MEGGGNPTRALPGAGREEERATAFVGDGVGDGGVDGAGATGRGRLDGSAIRGSPRWYSKWAEGTPPVPSPARGGRRTSDGVARSSARSMAWGPGKAEIGR